MGELRLRDDSGRLLTTGDRRIGDLATELRTVGFAAVPDALTPQGLALAQHEVRDYLTSHGGHAHELLIPAQWNCPTLTALGLDPALEAILATLAGAMVPPAVVSDFGSRSLRIFDGDQSARTNPNDWHYDASVITLLIAIIVPGNATGHHATVPNHRVHRKHRWGNIVDKALTQNRVHGRWTAREFARHPDGHTIRFTEGAGYLFTGHRTLHRAMEWPDGQVRATLNLHYGLPYRRARSADGPVLAAP